MVSTIETILVGQSKSTLTYYFLKKKDFFLERNISDHHVSVRDEKESRTERYSLC